MLQIIIQSVKQHLVPAIWISLGIFFFKQWFKKIKHRWILPENVFIEEATNAYTKHIWNSLSAPPLSTMPATPRNSMPNTKQQHNVHGSPLYKFLNPDIAPLLAQQYKLQLSSSSSSMWYNPSPYPRKPAESELNQDLAQGRLKSLRDKI